MSNDQKIIPVQYIQMPQPEEDEIDLKELFKTIWNHKKFIILFTTIITIFAIIYSLLKKPIYEIEASLQLGYINNTNAKLYLLEPFSTKIYLENIYKKDGFNKISLPTIDIKNPKHINDIYTLKIQAFSNKDALNYLDKILKDLKKKENKKITLMKDSVIKKVTILKNSNKRLETELKSLHSKLKTTKNSQLYATILNSISNIQTQITNNQLKIANSESILLPANLTNTHIIGKIKQSPYPIKPKKRLIVIVAFVTSFILSIFLVFFIEFIKGFKEEEE